MDSFNKLAIAYFSIELLFIYFAFGINVITHVGYLTDSLIIFTQLYLEINLYHSETRILNIFRLWRIVRVCNLIISFETEKLEIILKDKENIEIKYKKISLDYQQLDIELKNEQINKKSLETMLQSYKDEVETLNEALKIAAMDIAEVAQANDDDFISGDEDDEDIYQNDENDENKEENNELEDEFQDLAISEFDKSKNIESLIRVVRRDQQSNNSKPMKSSSSVISSNSSRSAVSLNNKTIVINKNGSYKSS